MTKGQGLNGSQVAGQVETTGHKVVSSNIGLKEFSHGFLCGKERAIVQNKMQSVLEWNRMGLGIAKPKETGWPKKTKGETFLLLILGWGFDLKVSRSVVDLKVSSI